jgi:hypothetical protein
MASIFTTEKWIRHIANVNPSYKVMNFTLDDEEVWFCEIKQYSIVIWFLYGEISTEQFKQLKIIAKREGADVIESTFHGARWTDESILEEVDLYSDFGTYQIDLTQDADTLFKGLSRNHRQNLKKAEKEEIQISAQFTPEDFPAIMDETYGSSSSHNYSQVFFESLKRTLDEQLIVQTATDRASRVIGFVLMVTDGTIAFALIRGQKREVPRGSGQFLMWESLKHLKAKGIETFDWCGARKSTEDKRLAGISRFKKEFGGDYLDCYYHITKINALKYSAYVFLRKLHSWIHHRQWAIFR